jgi:hypothetical protein
MAKRKEDTDHRPIRRLLVRLIKAPAAWSLVWPMVLLIGSYFAYKHWYADHLTQQFGQLSTEQIQISPPHRFVRTDLVEEVYQSTRLWELSPLDPRATAKLASAFASHPWIRHVRSVRKLPGGVIDLHLDYREPVAVFHLTGDQAWLKQIERYLADLGYPLDGGTNDLYFPLDGEGVMLPTEHMTLADTNELIQIEVWEVFPTGNEGTPFGDRRVESAALLAKLLAAVEDRVRVSKITVSGDPRWNLVPQLELVTTNNTHLVWGSPPGMEQPNERNAKAKLKDLLTGRFVPGADLRIADRAPAPLQ